MNNPYQPPSSDIAVSCDAPKRPATLKAAISLYLATIFLGVVGGLSIATSENFTAFTAIALIIILTIYLTGTYLVWAGWNWARIVCVIWVALDVVSRIPLASNFLPSRPILSALLLLIALLDILIIILLVNKKTSVWIKDLKCFRSGGF